MVERTGSFPLMNIAEDYGISYLIVLRYANYCLNVFRNKPTTVTDDTSTFELMRAADALEGKDADLILCGVISDVVWRIV